jgi:hypothetical protein
MFSRDFPDDYLTATGRFLEDNVRLSTELQDISFISRYEFHAGDWNMTSGIGAYEKSFLFWGWTTDIKMSGQTKDEATRE